jgi:hypothetical protein
LVHPLRLLLLLLLLLLLPRRGPLGCTQLVSVLRWQAGATAQHRQLLKRAAQQLARRLANSLRWGWRRLEAPQQIQARNRVAAAHGAC